MIISKSPYLRLVSAPICLFFLCCMLAALVAPIYAIGGSYALQNWAISITLAFFCSRPTALFWYGIQPPELRVYFDEGYYELRCGFRRFIHVTRGRFSDVDHLTLWNKQENRYDVSYTISLTWKNKRLPFTLCVLYNDQQKAVDRATDLAQRLNVSLYKRLTT